MSLRPFQNVPEFSWCYCNRCRGETHHARLFTSERQEAEDYDNDGSPTFVNRWVFIVWKCLGCDSVCLEERYWFEGYPDDVWDSAFYPKRKRKDAESKVFFRLPQTLATIYKEALIAFNNNAMVLCAAGLRGLIEGICTDRAINGPNLEQRINGLGKILPENIVKNLHGLRFMGNLAVHELTPPKDDELRLAIEICEDLLNFLYELDYKTGRLAKNRK